MYELRKSKSIYHPGFDIGDRFLPIIIDITIDDLCKELFYNCTDSNILIISY